MKKESKERNLWRWIGAVDRCWRCGGVLNSDFIEEVPLIPEHLGGKRDNFNLAKLDSKCARLLRSKLLPSLSAENPFACPECGEVGRVLKIDEEEERIVFELWCPQCGIKFKARDERGEEIC